MASQPKRILIVEDEKPLARALELKLLNWKVPQKFDTFSMYS